MALRRLGSAWNRWRGHDYAAQVAARAASDFLIVQASAVLSLLMVGLRLQEQEAMTAAAGIAILRNYYLGVFLPLSAVFPAVYWTFGVYTTVRTYPLVAKLERVAISSVVATFSFISLNFLFTRTNSLPRSSAVLFALLVILGTCGSRWLKAWIFEPEVSGTRPRGTGLAPNERNRVLVVGGAGYIGVLVLERLLAKGLKVRLLDCLMFGDKATSHLVGHPGLEVVVGDCRNIQDVVRAMADVRDVVHLAAVVGDPACNEDDKNALEINYAATRMMIEIAKGHGVERFVFASSCSVYGESEHLVDESSVTAPVSLYAATKVNSEKVLLEAMDGSFRPVILRFATVFGLAPRPRFDLVVNLLAARALQEGVITVMNGSQWRPFIHARDIAEAVWLVLSAPIDAVRGEIFNVGDDRLNYTLDQIAHVIAREVPSTRVVREDNGDRRNYRVSFAKIRERLGFTASKSIEDGVREVRDAFAHGVINDYRSPQYSNILHIRERGRFDSGSAVSSKVMAAFADKV